MAIFQKSKLAPAVGEISPRCVNVHESIENYLDHPTFGLLYSLCTLEDDRELFTTLYAMRLFFLSVASPTSVKLEPINRNEARLLVEKRLRELRSIGELREYDKLQARYQQMFLR